MSWVRVTRILDRDEAIDGLMRIRQEWQEAANGKPLTEMRGNVGLMLEDVIDAMGLLPDEAARVMGSEIISAPGQLCLKV